MGLPLTSLCAACGSAAAATAPRRRAAGDPRGPGCHTRAVRRDAIQRPRDVGRDTPACRHVGPVDRLQLACQEQQALVGGLPQARALRFSGGVARCAAHVPQICEIASVEEFWAVYSQIPDAEALHKGNTCARGIEVARAGCHRIDNAPVAPAPLQVLLLPQRRQADVGGPAQQGRREVAMGAAARAPWRPQHCLARHGGWRLRIANVHPDSVAALPRQMLAMIGGQFGDDDAHVVGAVMACRQKGDKLSLWTGDATNEDACLRVGYQALYACSLRAGVAHAQIFASRALKDALKVTGVLGYQVGGGLFGPLLLACRPEWLTPCRNLM